MAKDKRVYITDNTVKFGMEVTRDKTKGTPEHFIYVQVNVTGVTLSDVLVSTFSGSGMRVRLAAKLRMEPEATLDRYEVEGYKCTWSDITAKVSRVITVEHTNDLFMAMDLDQFIEVTMEQFGFTYEYAVSRYNFKHGISDEPDNEDEDE